jgi:hypothetical protein
LVREALYLPGPDAEVHERLPAELQPRLELRLHRLVHAEAREVLQLFHARRADDYVYAGL